MKLPAVLPKQPTGFTKVMSCHINRGRDGASASYEVFAPDGTKLPVMYAYTTGRGHRVERRGFYLAGSDECLSWDGLVARWPVYVKALGRLIAKGMTVDEAIRAASDAAPIAMVVIYERPRDLPNGFVARRWEVRPGQCSPAELLGSDLPTVDAARELVPAGLVNIGRVPEDDAKIVEVWV